MKILHLLSQRPECTGSGFFFQAMLEQSSKKGYQNYAVCGVTPQTIPDQKIFCGAKTDFILFNGIDIDYPVAGMSDVMPYENKRFKDLTPKELSKYKEVFLNKATKAVNDFKPDIILSHHLWIMSSIVKKNFPDIPIAVISHGTDLRQLKNCPNIREDIIEGLGNLDIVYALSKNHKKEIEVQCSIDNEKIFVTGSGFNESLFHYKKQSTPKTLKILYAGKLAFAKGLPILLETIKDMLDLPFELYIAGAGTGKDKDLCIKLAKECGDKVTLLGALNQKELVKHMQSSQIFILPSFFEGLPLVILEALSCGCRIITTDLDGAKELAKKGSEDLIKFITLPELETIDKPYEKDIPLIKKRIKEKILEFSKDISINPNTDPKKIDKLTSPYKWSEVFNKIDLAFKTLI